MEGGLYHGKGGLVQPWKGDLVSWKGDLGEFRYGIFLGNTVYSK
jgi:hypothetical protein